MSGKADDSKWILEEHTKRKHRVLEYYLGIWSQILGKPFVNLIYWDFFAGRGNYSKGEEGSPLIAMKVSNERFEKGNSEGRPIIMTCMFIEEDKNCYYYLRDLLRELYPDLEGTRWHLFNGDCQEIYDKLQQPTGDPLFRKRLPQFFFLDPYGPMLPLKRIEQLMSDKFREVILNFMVEWVNRFVNDEAQEKNLKAIFGIEDISILKEIKEQEDSLPKFADFYISRLSADNGARIRYVTRPFNMIPDRRQSTLYYLIGCTNSSKGLRIMSETMGAISSHEDYSYQGRFDGQTTLEWLLGDKIEEIAEWIFMTYPHNKANSEQIYTFCCGKKTSSRPDVTAAIHRLENEGKIIVQPKPGRKRIGNTLSDHVIRFQRNQ